MHATKLSQQRRAHALRHGIIRPKSQAENETARLQALYRESSFDNSTQEFSTNLSRSFDWLFLLQKAQYLDREAIAEIIQTIKDLYITKSHTFVQKICVKDAIYDICELHEMELTFNQFALAMCTKPASKNFALALNVLKFFGSDLQYCDSTLKANVMCVKVASTAHKDACSAENNESGNSTACNHVISDCKSSKYFVCSDSSDAICHFFF